MRWPRVLRWPIGPISPIGPMRLIGPMIFLLLALAACSGESGGEQPVPAPEQPAAIAFAGSMQEATDISRSATPLSGDAQMFTVYGFKNMSMEAGSYADEQMVFPGYLVRWHEGSSSTSTTNTSGWEYVNQQLPGAAEQTVKYWDYAATAYRFMGVTGTVVSGAYGSYPPYATHETHEAYNLSFRADGENAAATPFYSHLWFASDFGSQVTLEFVKPLCQVRFMFIFEDPAAAAANATELTEKNFRPTDGNTIKLKGTVTVSYPLLGAATSEALMVDADASGLNALTQDYYESVTKNEDDVVTEPYYGAAETPLSYWYTVLPMPDGQGSYTLTVSVDGEPKSTVVPAKYMTWLPGYKYTYIFKVHVDKNVGLESVQSAFTDWRVEEAVRTIYNW
ncbi:MAG: hypothetical protein IJ637_04885 [Prevotella sp.]|nr:hypothetical protein [Prevotella sp.]